ncbi:MAG: hypothetical protein P8189_28100 [Anaerolineae bacterium]|jgi:hypothetical protein
MQQARVRVTEGSGKCSTLDVMTGGRRLAATSSFQKQDVVVGYCGSAGRMIRIEFCGH